MLLLAALLSTSSAAAGLVPVERPSEDCGESRLRVRQHSPAGSGMESQLRKLQELSAPYERARRCSSGLETFAETVKREMLASKKRGQRSAEIFRTALSRKGKCPNGGDISVHLLDASQHSLVLFKCSRDYGARHWFRVRRGDRRR